MLILHQRFRYNSNSNVYFFLVYAEKMRIFGSAKLGIYICTLIPLFT